MVVGECWFWLEKEPREGPTRDVTCARGYAKGKETNVPPDKRYRVAFPVARNDSTASRCRFHAEFAAFGIRSNVFLRHDTEKNDSRCNTTSERAAAQFAVLDHVSITNVHRDRFASRHALRCDARHCHINPRTLLQGI